MANLKSIASNFTKIAKLASGLLQVGATGEVSTAVRSIAPDAIFRPVPGGHAELSVVAVCDRTPARREGLLDDVRRIDFVDIGARQYINGTAKGAVRIKRIDGVARRCVDANGRGLPCPRTLGKRKSGLRHQR